MAKETYEVLEGQGQALGFSQAVRVGNHIYVSGTIGIGPDMQLPESLSEQLRLAYQNVAETLAHFGATLGDVVAQTVFVTDLDHAFACGDVRQAAFANLGFPTSAMVEVSKLAIGAKVEIQTVAYVED
jgi:enamine deaminase RidA (YjgF/YER057c/UK114 family)